jgi:amino acid adenylation domain-containing protein
MTRTLLQSFLTAQADKRPDAPALVMGQERLTFGELERRTNQLARLLRDSGLKRDDRIAVLMPKSPDAIVSFLGVLKADCIYVPMDPGSPPARIEKMLQSSGARWILASGPAAGALDGIFRDGLHSGLSVGWFGASASAGRNFIPKFGPADVLGHDTTACQSQNNPDDAAHILFTSGSTGSPKGVIITHENVVRFVQWGVGYFGIDSSDRNSGHSPLQFDLSTFDIYGALAAGAALYLVPPELNIVPHKLTEFIRQNELTQWFSAPAILNHMAKFDAVKQNDFPSLKRLLWCGEVFPTPALMHWMQRLPHVAFTNLYGPTEATIASSYYTVPQCPTDEKSAIPIGTPCEGEALLVLDDDLRPLPTGETGALYISGVGLSPGYWEDPERTAAAFLANPNADRTHARIYKTGDLARVGADGLVYFVGRADTQIKSRGYRIELGEIETALNALDALRECAVVAIETGGLEGKAICCAFVPADGSELAPVSIRKQLSASLPAYMLPARWMRCDVLPKNSNGKIDRRRIREQFEGSTAADDASAGDELRRRR